MWEYLEVLWRFPSASPSLGINQFYPQTILVIGYAMMLARLLQTYILWMRDGAQGLPGMLAEDGDAEQHGRAPVANRVGLTSITQACDALPKGGDKPARAA